MAPRPPFRLCLLLTRELCARPPLVVVERAVAGGVDCVQLREKAMDTRERHAWAVELQELCRRLAVPLVINDDADVALAVGADGLHLGQQDLHPADARSLLGEGPWIGWSTHDLEQLAEAGRVGVDYAGFGPVFPAPTKGYRDGLGPAAVALALEASLVPVVAIGGIDARRAVEIPGGAALAVSSAICGADDPGAAAAAIAARGGRP